MWIYINMVQLLFIILIFIGLLRARSGEFIENRYKMIFKCAHDPREISSIYFFFCSIES